MSLKLPDQPDMSASSKPLVQNSSKQRFTREVQLLEINWVWNPGIKRRLIQNTQEISLGGFEGVKHSLGEKLTLKTGKLSEHKGF